MKNDKNIVHSSWLSNTKKKKNKWITYSIKYRAIEYFQHVSIVKYKYKQFTYLMFGFFTLSFYLVLIECEHCFWYKYIRISVMTSIWWKLVCRMRLLEMSRRSSLSYNPRIYLCIYKQNARKLFYWTPFYLGCSDMNLL